MVLGSQSPRSGRSRNNPSHRKKKSGALRWFIGAVVLIVIAVLIYWALPSAKKTSEINLDNNNTPLASGDNHLADNNSSSDSKSINKSDSNNSSNADNDSKKTDHISSIEHGSDKGSLDNSDVATLNLDGSLAKRKQNDKEAKQNPQANDQKKQTLKDSNPPLNKLVNKSKQSYSSNAQMSHGMDLIADKKWVEGRKALSKVLFSDKSLSDADAQTIRDTLASINKQLIFSDKIYSDDPLEVSYKVQSGDTLSGIAPHFHIPYQFIERINNVKGRYLRAGQTIKLIKGPFNVKVVKHLFLIDVYLNGPDGLPVYVCSFPVGLGKENSTPVGKWVIQAGHKVKNPDYTDPRSGKHFNRNDPKNPVGEYWMGLKGTGENTKGLSSYGIHGTIEPDSIGKEDSLGCIRLGDNNIKRLFHMLVGGKSKVEVLP